MEHNLTTGSRRQSNQSAIDKKRKKKRKKKKEGKRSSASSASVSGSPDSNGPYPPKAQTSFSCPSIVNPDQSKSFNDASKEDSISNKVNECLRWPAHSSYIENSFRSDVIGRFPVAGTTEEEENERIAIYKMNRRKRYLAAQQALINKYPDVYPGVYASSSGSSSGHDNEERIRISSSRSSAPSSVPKPEFHSAHASPDSAMRESRQNIHEKYFSNADMALALAKDAAKGVVKEARKNVFSGI